MQSLFLVETIGRKREENVHKNKSNLRYIHLKITYLFKEIVQGTTKVDNNHKALLNTQLLVI